MLTKSVAVSDDPGTAANGRYDSAAQRDARAAVGAPIKMRIAARTATDARERPMVTVDGFLAAGLASCCYQGTPAETARNFISGAISLQAAMNVFMKSSDRTCLFVTFVPEVKLFRLMSSIIG